MSTAREFMTRDVVTVQHDCSLDDAIAAILDNQVSGLIVTSPSGTLEGVVSEYALLEIVYKSESKSDCVLNHMSTDVITVTEDATINEVANLLILHRIRRVPVLRDDKVVGVISRRDVLRAARDATSTAVA